MRFIIEHLEAKLSRWSFLEYTHISKIVGRRNLIFTNVKKGKSRLRTLGRVYKKSASGLGLKNACVLDPSAKKQLSPKEAKCFDSFVFGGILGDFPARKRTAKKLRLKAVRRSLGKKQLATDNAVYIVKKIASGVPISRIKFKNKVVLKIKPGEEIILPFRYVLAKGKPLISKELMAMLRRQKGF